MADNIPLKKSPEIDWNKKDLVTCVELNYTKPDADAQNDSNVALDGVYHFIYGSQLYGTLFGVYGKFTYDISKDKSVCYVNGVDLQLLNYEGVMNIGFCAMSANDIPGDANEKRHYYFGVKGTSLDHSIYVTFPDPIKLDNGIHTRIKFCRVLYPLDGFDTKPKTSTNLQLGEIPNSECFDTEFHYRSGIDYYNNVLRPGMAGYKVRKSSRESIRTNILVSVRCHESNVNLLYNATKVK